MVPNMGHSHAVPDSLLPRLAAHIPPLNKLSLTFLRFLDGFQKDSISCLNFGIESWMLVTRGNGGGSYLEGDRPCVPCASYGTASKLSLLLRTSEESSS